MVVKGANFNIFKLLHPCKLYIEIIRWEVKQIKASAIENPFLGGEEMVEWFKSLPSCKTMVLSKDWIKNVLLQ